MTCDFWQVMSLSAFWFQDVLGQLTSELPPRSPPLEMSSLQSGASSRALGGRVEQHPTPRHGALGPGTGSALERSAGADKATPLVFSSGAVLLLSIQDEDPAARLGRPP